VARHGSHVVTVASRVTPRPFGLRAAEASGAPARGPWLVVLGQGDDLTRAVFLTAPHHLGEDAVAIKLARIPGAARGSFDRDAAGLALAAEAGIGHVPALLGRFEVAGCQGSVETAGAGEQIGRILVSRGRRSAHAIVQSVLEWTIELARRTLTPAGVPAADQAGILPAVAELPRVTAHNDLGSWNVVSRGTDFTVVDWESARPDGLPLSDALYFATDALGLLAGARTQDERMEAAVALHTGSSPLSAVLFAALRRSASALSLPETAIGPLGLACWLGHAASRDDRVQALGDGRPAADEPYAGRLGAVWLRDARLGAEWPAFHAS
jgi:hypothetical protein